MKTLKNIKIALSLLVFIGAFSSCVNDADYDTPQVQEQDTYISNSTIDAVKNTINQQFAAGNPATLVYTFPDDSPVVIPAYVVSDDTAGNFYKKLIVQDSPSAPTGGLEISIDQGSLHTQYNIGRKLYIKMAGLTVGYIDGQTSNPGYANASDPTDAVPGIYRVGVLGNDYKVDRIPATEFENHIVRASVTEAIVPAVITTADFDDTHMNTFIQMDNVQVEASDLGKTFAGEAGDQYDATRSFFNCTEEVGFGVMTSTFSNFKAMVMPSDKGTIKAVLMKNYRERDAVVVLNSYEDIDFTDTNRCGFGLLDCPPVATVGSTVLFSEDFESYAEDETAYPGWTAVNVNAGARLFRNRSYSGNKYSEASAYGSGENPMEVWLVTPAIDLDTTTDEVLTFKTKAHHDNGSVLTVLVSTDFTGDVTTATWMAVDATIGTSSSSGYGSSTNSGNISLSCLSGNVYVAFKYKGGDGGITTGMQLDDIMVKGN